MSFNKSEAVRNAEKFLAQGKIRQAVNEYQEIVKRDPEDITNLNILGDLLVKSNQTDDALKCFCRVAEHYNDKGFPQKAIAIYNKIFRFRPDCTDTLEKLAELNRAKGAVAEARNQYKKLAEFYERLGETEKLISSWKALADLDRQNPDICFKLGELCRKTSHPKEAADAFAEAGDRLFAKNSLDQSLEAYHAALAEEPEHVKGFQGFVRIALIRGTYIEAVDKLENILNDQPENPDLRELLAECYLEMGEVFKAEDILMGLVTQESSRYRHLLRILKTHIANGEAKSAMRILSITADHLLSEDDPDRLLAWTEEILARDPSNLDAMRLQARYHTSKGDVLAATAILDQISVMAAKSVAQSAPIFDAPQGFESQELEQYQTIDDGPKELELFGSPMPDYTFEGQSEEMAFEDSGISTVESYSSDEYHSEGPAREFVAEESAREFIDTEVVTEQPIYESTGTGDYECSTAENEMDEVQPAFIAEGQEACTPAQGDDSFDEVPADASPAEDHTIASASPDQSISSDNVFDHGADLEESFDGVDMSESSQSDVEFSSEDENDNGFEIVSITHEKLGPIVARGADLDGVLPSTLDADAANELTEVSEQEFTEPSMDGDSFELLPSSSDLQDQPIASTSEMSCEPAQPEDMSCEAGVLGEGESLQDSSLMSDDETESEIRESLPTAALTYEFEFNGDSSEADPRGWDDSSITEETAEVGSQSFAFIDPDSTSEEVHVSHASGTGEFEPTSVLSSELDEIVAQPDDVFESHRQVSDDFDAPSFADADAEHLGTGTDTDVSPIPLLVEFEPTAFVEPVSAPSVDGSTEFEFNEVVTGLSEQPTGDLLPTFSGEQAEVGPQEEPTFVDDLPHSIESMELGAHESVAADEWSAASPRLKFLRPTSQTGSASMHCSDELTESSIPATGDPNPFAPHIDFDFGEFAEEDGSGDSIEKQRESLVDMPSFQGHPAPVVENELIKETVSEGLMDSEPSVFGSFDQGFESRMESLVAEMDLAFIDPGSEESEIPDVDSDSFPEADVESASDNCVSPVEELFGRLDHAGNEYLTDSPANDHVEPETAMESVLPCVDSDVAELPIFEEVCYPKMRLESDLAKGGSVVDAKMSDENVSDVQARENRLSSLLDSVDFFINEGFFEVAKKNFDAVVAEFGHRPQFAELEERLALFAAHYDEEQPVESLMNANASLLSVSPEPYDPDFPELSTLGMYTPEEIKNMVQVVEIDEDMVFDYETFYDTATAYREMGLLDYAVREFENALKIVKPNDGTRRFFQCCNMLGHCFMEYGKPDLAVMWFRRAQDVPGLTADEDLALLYEIARALEAHGKSSEAAKVIGRINSAANGYSEVNDLFRKITQN